MHSFKTGVENFWQWFPTVAPRFYETINNGDCAELADEVGAFMAENLPGLAWVFGPSESDGHSLTVSGDGIPAKQLLAFEWLRHAVDLDGWTFYSSRQPGNLDSIALDIGESGQVDADSILIKTDVDEENKVVDIVAWHPAFEELPEDTRYQIVFLMLDEAMGEFGTQTWVGEIEIKPLTLDIEHTKPLTELPQYIHSVESYHKWEKPIPTESYAAYELQEQYPGPRGDTIVGTSLLPHPFIDFIAGEGKLEDNPLSDAGAQLAYISLDATSLPDGEQADARGNMEDAIDEVLQSHRCGRVLGGAFGIKNAYIDLLIFDSQQASELLQQQIASLQISSGVLHFID